MSNTKKERAFIEVIKTITQHLGLNSGMINYCVSYCDTIHKTEINTSNALILREITRHFHALQTDLISQQMGLGWASRICINTCLHILD